MGHCACAHSGVWERQVPEVGGRVWGAYRSDLGGGAGARRGLQGPPRAAAVAPHTQVAQILPAQALGAVGAAHGAVVDLHCGRHGGGQLSRALLLKSQGPTKCFVPSPTPSPTPGGC